MGTKEKEYQLTHFIPTTPPPNGKYNTLKFYSKNIATGEYFLGTGDKAYTLVELNRHLALTQDDIIVLAEPIQFEGVDTMLVMDDKRSLYLKTPHVPRVKIGRYSKSEKRFIPKEKAVEV